MAEDDDSFDSILEMDAKTYAANYVAEQLKKSPIRDQRGKQQLYQLQQQQQQQRQRQRDYINSVYGENNTMNSNTSPPPPHHHLQQQHQNHPRGGMHKYNQHHQQQYPQHGMDPFANNQHYGIQPPLQQQQQHPPPPQASMNSFQSSPSFITCDPPDMNAMIGDELNLNNSAVGGGTSTGAGVVMGSLDQPTPNNNNTNNTNIMNLALGNSTTNTATTTSMNNRNTGNFMELTKDSLENINKIASSRRHEIEHQQQQQDAPMIQNVQRFQQQSQQLQQQQQQEQQQPQFQQQQQSPRHGMHSSPMRDNQQPPQPQASPSQFMMYQQQFHQRMSPQAQQRMSQFHRQQQQFHQQKFQQQQPQQQKPPAPQQVLRQQQQGPNSSSLQQAFDDASGSLPLSQAGGVPPMENNESHPKSDEQNNELNMNPQQQTNHQHADNEQQHQKEQQLQQQQTQDKSSPKEDPSLVQIQYQQPLHPNHPNYYLQLRSNFPRNHPHHPPSHPNPQIHKIQYGHHHHRHQFNRPHSSPPGMVGNPLANPNGRNIPHPFQSPPPPPGPNSNRPPQMLMTINNKNNNDNNQMMSKQGKDSELHHSRTRKLLSALLNPASSSPAIPKNKIHNDNSVKPNHKKPLFSYNPDDPMSSSTSNGRDDASRMYVPHPSRMVAEIIPKKPRGAASHKKQLNQRKPKLATLSDLKGNEHKRKRAPFVTYSFGTCVKKYAVGKQTKPESKKSGSKVKMSSTSSLSPSSLSHTFYSTPYLTNKNKHDDDQLLANDDGSLIKYPTELDMANAIPENASSIFHILDRRIDFDAFPDDASFYSLIRAWVQDDPYRLRPLEGGVLLDHVSLPSKRRRENDHPVSLVEKKIEKDSLNLTLKNEEYKPKKNNGMNVLSVVKVMNKEDINDQEKSRLMEIISNSSKQEEMEVSDMAPTSDRQSMLTEYILKAKQKKFDVKKKRKIKHAVCKKRLESLGIHI